MVIGTLSGPDGGLVIGLSFKNLARLAAGRPIHQEYKMPGLRGTLIILAGEDEKAIVGYLKKVGAITPDTQDLAKGA